MVAIQHPAVFDWFNAQTPEVRTMLESLRFLIFTNVPDVEEGWKWKVPFYSRSGWLCYLNVQKGRAILAFVEGFLLEDSEGCLNRDTSNVRKMTFSSLAEVEGKEKVVADFFRQAMAINQGKDKNFLNIPKSKK